MVVRWSGSNKTSNCTTTRPHTSHDTWTVKAEIHGKIRIYVMAYDIICILFCSTHFVPKISLQTFFIMVLRHNFLMNWTLDYYLRVMIWNMDEIYREGHLQKTLKNFLQVVFSIYFIHRLNHYSQVVIKWPIHQVIMLKYHNVKCV